MIATRRRRRRLSLGPFLLPVAAIGALIFALLFPPSHKLIFEGPAAPAIRAAGNLGSVAFQPFHFAAQNQTIADRNREIRRLNAALEESRKTLAARDSAIDDLRAQNAQLRAAPAPAPAIARTVKPLANGPIVPAQGPTGAGPALEARRAASVWATMDAEKAAAIARRLPEDYVASVLALMPPESAGDVLAALPADLAARLTAAAGASRSAGKP